MELIRCNQIIPVAAGGSSLLTGLLAAWETSNVNDSSGNGNTLTNHNTVTFISGQVGNTGHFVSASSQWLSIANNSFVGFGDHDYTIEAWVKLVSNGVDCFLIAKDSDTGQNYSIEYVQAAFTFAFKINGNEYIQNFASGYPVSSATWYQLVCWYDKAAGSINIRVNDAGTDSLSPVTQGGNSSGTGLSIGRRDYPGFEGYANADIGPVRLWNRVLTSLEITSLYNGGAGLSYPF